MARKKATSGPQTPPAAGYSETARTVLQEGASRVQEMHEAIAGQTFAVLKGIPLVGGPAQAVQHVHDALVAGIYGAVRLGGDGMLGMAAALERQGDGDKPDDPPSRLASSVRSALNGAFGDYFADANSVLAIAMGLHVAGAPVPLERAALAAAYPVAGERLCLFIHGLGCDEHCWEAGGEGVAMPAQLEADTGRTALTLRYNTGLPIVDNGARLAVLLTELVAAWPRPVAELVIVGHSMGGLVARSACAQAAEANLSWLAQVRMVVCLGSPHLGAPLEKLGELATVALRLSAITEPLARIAAKRSQGIQDLRHGLGAQAETAGNIAWRFIGGSFAEDPTNPLGEIIGDGLVTLNSATAHELTGDVQSLRLGSVGHMGLLHDVRVYEQLRAWLGDGVLGGGPA